MTSDFIHIDFVIPQYNCRYPITGYDEFYDMTEVTAMLKCSITVRLPIYQPRFTRRNTAYKILWPKV